MAGDEGPGGDSGGQGGRGGTGQRLSSLTKAPGSDRARAKCFQGIV